VVFEKTKRAMELGRKMSGERVADLEASVEALAGKLSAARAALAAAAGGVPR
jgi:hypothetical protein